MLELAERETLNKEDLERILAPVHKRPPHSTFAGFGKRTPSDRPPIEIPRAPAGPTARPTAPNGTTPAAGNGAGRGRQLAAAGDPATGVRAGVGDGQRQHAAPSYPPAPATRRRRTTRRRRATRRPGLPAGSRYPPPGARSAGYPPPGYPVAPGYPPPQSYPPLDAG